MQPRIRRLRSDHEQVERIFGAHPRIRMIESEGEPPDRYAFQFSVKGLSGTSDGEPIESRQHRADVFLPLDYPRRAPICRMTTRCFHPNIDPQKICIGDHWSAGQSLSELVVRIAELICFQSYNTRSPLNALAAEWTEKNLHRLALEREDLTAGLL